MGSPTRSPRSIRVLGSPIGNPNPSTEVAGDLGGGVGVAKSSHIRTAFPLVSCRLGRFKKDIKTIKAKNTFVVLRETTEKAQLKKPSPFSIKKPRTAVRAFNEKMQDINQPQRKSKNGQKSRATWMFFQ
ncbi:hypothetical protein CDL15_Pgr000471 [Punica granatum]|uniref:Uncharacterized protein n=1 Tax=Punica granatum TaxID=22663 RepID=A0A218W3B1_PUNGR|nr:hypothetical protein CDL15_Pgr000471 [Punica granatum]